MGNKKYISVTTLQKQAFILTGCSDLSLFFACIFSQKMVKCGCFCWSSLVYVLVFLVLCKCSAPVHAKKRKSEQALENYEKMPRKMQQEEEKELIHLLPIKDKSGLIPQCMEKPGACVCVCVSALQSCDSAEGAWSLNVLFIVLFSFTAGRRRGTKPPGVFTKRLVWICRHFIKINFSRVSLRSCVVVFDAQNLPIL